MTTVWVAIVILYVGFAFLVGILLPLRSRINEVLQHAEQVLHVVENRDKLTAAKDDRMEGIARDVRRDTKMAADLAVHVAAEATKVQADQVADKVVARLKGDNNSSKDSADKLPVLRPESP